MTVATGAQNIFKITANINNGIIIVLGPAKIHITTNISTGSKHTITGNIKISIIKYGKSITSFKTDVI